MTSCATQCHYWHVDFQLAELGSNEDNIILFTVELVGALWGIMISGF